MSDQEIQRLRPLPALLDEVKNWIVDEMHSRAAEAGYGDLRPSHGCVFRFVDRTIGSRLTELAEQAGLTKQAVGEAVADLEARGYVERVPDPADGRAKIIRLTPRGLDACRTAERLFAEIEAEWAERVGEVRLAALREALERIVESGDPALRPALPA
jgi:DNA-binding MarR family transcriptional regulator